MVKIDLQNNSVIFLFLFCLQRLLLNIILIVYTRQECNNTKMNSSYFGLKNMWCSISEALRAMDYWVVPAKNVEAIIIIFSYTQIDLITQFRHRRAVQIFNIVFCLFPWKSHILYMQTDCCPINNELRIGKNKRLNNAGRSLMTTYTTPKL